MKTILSNKEESIIYFTDDLQYVVHFDTKSRLIKFKIYNALMAEDGTLMYDIDNCYEEKFDKNKCEARIEGTYVWRGCWEGRLYFTDEEYWSEELNELADLFRIHIEPWCKECIKEKEPDYNYD